MPLVRSEIDLVEIIRVMHSRGYGDHHDGRYALAFNKKDPVERWKLTGEPKRRPAGGGVSPAQLVHIRRHSENAVEAADRVEAIILGKEMLPLDEQGEQPQAPAIDTAVMEKMVVNRIDSQIGRHMTPVIDVLGKLTDRLEQIEKALVQPKAEPPVKHKGKGRKIGSRNKPKDEPVIDFGPRVPSDVKP